MDLATLKFNLDTSTLDSALGKITQIGVEFGKIGQIQTKVAAQVKKATSDSAQAQNDANKASKDGVQGEEQLTKAVDKSIKAEKDRKSALDQSSSSSSEFTKVTQRQISIEEFMRQGFSKTQASSLAAAKALGAQEEELLTLSNTMKNIRAYQGNDPFDKSVGLINSLTQQYRQMGYSIGIANTEMASSTKLTKNQIDDLAREYVRLEVAGKAAGMTEAEIKAVMEETARTANRLWTSINGRTAAIKAQEDATKRAVTAEQYLEKEMNRVAFALEDANKGLMRTTNNLLVRFQNELKNSGFSLTEQTTLLEQYRSKLIELEKLKHGSSNADYISRAVGPQITDIFVGLATGQSPYMVALQQGGQLRDQMALMQVEAKDMSNVMRGAMLQMVTSLQAVAKAMVVLVAGGIKDMFLYTGKLAMDFSGVSAAMDRAKVAAAALGTEGFDKIGKLVAMGRLLQLVFASLLTPAIAALVFLAYEMYKTMQASTQFNQALLTTGARLGLTKDSAIELAKTLRNTGKSTADVLNVLTEMAQAGNLPRESLDGIARSAINMEKYLGIATKNTVELFSELRKTPFETLSEFAVQTGKVSEATLLEVRALERKGEAQKATAVATKAMLEAQKELANIAKQNLTPLELFYLNLKDAVSRGKQAVLDFVEYISSLSLSVNFKAFSDLTKWAVDFAKKILELKGFLTDLGDLSFTDKLKQVAFSIGEAIGTGLSNVLRNKIPSMISNLISGETPVSKSESENRRNLRDSENKYADQLRTDESTARAAKQSVLLKEYSEKEIASMRELEKATYLLKKAETELKEQRDKGLLSAAAEASASKYITRLRQDQARAAFAEVSKSFRPLSDFETQKAEMTKKAFDRSISFYKEYYNDLEALNKSRFESGIVKEGQYLAEKQRIEAEGLDTQRALTENYLTTRDSIYNEDLAITNKWASDRAAIISKSGMQGWREMLKALEIEVAKKRQELEVARGDEVARVANDLSKAQLALARMNQINMNKFRKEVIDSQESLREFNREVDVFLQKQEIERQRDLKIMWATPEQAAYIAASSKMTEQFAGKISELAKKAEDAAKSFNELNASMSMDEVGPPGLEYWAAYDAMLARKKAANEAFRRSEIEADIAGNKAVLDEYEKQRHAFIDDVSKTLVDALTGGGRDSAKRIRDLIVAELKKPIVIYVKAVLNELTGANGLLGGLFGGNGQAGGGILQNLLGNFGSTGGGLLGSLLGGYGELAGPTLGGEALIGSSGLAGMLGSAGFTGAAGFLGGLASPIATLGTALNSGIAAAGGFASVLGAAVPIIGGIIAIASAMGVFNNETGIKIDNSVRDGRGRKDIIDSALGQFDVSGDLENKIFDPLIKKVQQMDKYIADNLLTEETLATVKERIQQISSDATDWFGFEDEAGAKVAIEKASKLFLQQRYGTVFEEINKTIADKIKAFTGTADELITFLTDTFSVLETLKQAAPQLKNIFGEIIDIDAVLKYQKEGETLGAAFQRLVSVFTVTNSAAMVLGKEVSNAFGVVGIASVEARESLVKFAGGVEQLQSKVDFYLNNFFSEAERRALAVKAAQGALNDGFAQLGMSVPRTRDEFRRLISGLDLSTESGRQMYAALLNLAPAMATVTDTTSETIAEVRTLAGITKDSIKSMFESIMKEATSAEDARKRAEEAAGEMFYNALMDSLLNAVTDIVMKSIVEPMSASLLPIIDATTAATSAVAAIKDTGDILKASGLFTGQVIQEAALIGSQESITGASVASSAIATGGAVASVDITTGASIASSAITMAGMAMGESVVTGAVALSMGFGAAIRQVVSVIETMTQVMQSPEFQQAYRQFVAAMGQIASTLYTGAITLPGYTPPTGNGNGTGTGSNSPDNAAQRTYDLLVAAINKEKELAQKRLDWINKLLDITNNAISELLQAVDSTKQMTYDNARAFLAQAGIDIAAGILPDESQYSEAVKIAVAGVQGATYATLADEQRAKLLLANELQNIADTLGPQKTEMERQLEYLDQLLVTAKSQLDAITGNTTAILTLAQAIANWATVTGNTLPTYTSPSIQNPVNSGNVFSRAPTLTLNGQNLNAANETIDDDLLEELKALREEVQGLRIEVRADVSANTKVAKILERVTPDGTSLHTVAA